MLLQALTRYYEILAQDEESDIAPPGYSVTPVSFALNLSLDGQLLDVLPLVSLQAQGKKMVERPRRLRVPEQVKRSSGISANFLYDSCAYVLGISSKDEVNPAYAAGRFEEFRRWNQHILAQADSPAARAVLAFLENYDPRHAQDHPALARNWGELMKGGNLVFCVEGLPGFVHEDAAVRQAWAACKAAASNTYLGQCLVSGETGPIARLHPSLKGVTDANPTGATLVGFNARAYESYNRSGGQGLNAPVGEAAAFAYTTVLNYLLSRDNPNRKLMIGDTTVVYWADSPNRAYARAFSGLFQAGWEAEPAPPAADGPARSQPGADRLAEVAQKVRRGEPLDAAALMEDLDPATRFYVLGLAPNAARLSVRFFFQDAFQEAIAKIMRHYADLQIEKEFDNQPTWIPLYQLLGETYSKKSSEKKASPLLAGAMLRAILQGLPYPAAFYYALLTRIRADQDDKDHNIQKINYVRAAGIQAYLRRKYRSQPHHPIQEVLCMSLNEQSTQPAYILGRLFAVLEKVQHEAVPGAEATIKDRYFTAACATPGSVFPVLLRLAQHHIAKAEYGYASDQRIEKLLNLLEIDRQPFPAHLGLDDQGVFVLGYYHQRAAFYLKSEKNRPPTDPSEDATPLKETLA